MVVPRYGQTVLHTNSHGAYSYYLHDRAEFRTSTTSRPKRHLPRLVPRLHERCRLARESQVVLDLPLDLRIQVAFDMDFFSLHGGEGIEEGEVRTHHHALALEVDRERLEVAVLPKAVKAAPESLVVDEATLIVGEMWIRDLRSVREDECDVAHERDVVMPDGAEAFLDVRVAGLGNVCVKPAADAIWRSSEDKAI